MTIDQNLLIDRKVESRKVLQLFDQSPVCQPIKIFQLNYSQLYYLIKHWRSENCDRFQVNTNKKSHWLQVSASKLLGDQSGSIKKPNGVFR